MKRFYNFAKEKIDSNVTRLHVKASCFAYRYSTELLFLSGVVMLAAGLTTIAHAQTETGTKVEFNDWYIRQAVCQLYVLIEGSYGALLMAVAGLGAIVSAAMGGYKAAMSCMVVACGSMVIRPIVRLYFNDVTGGNAGCRRGSTDNEFVKLNSFNPNPG